MNLNPTTPEFKVELPPKNIFSDVGSISVMNTNDFQNKPCLHEQPCPGDFQILKRQDSTSICGKKKHRIGKIKKEEDMEDGVEKREAEILSAAKELAANPILPSAMLEIFFDNIFDTVRIKYKTLVVKLKICDQESNVSGCVDLLKYLKEKYLS